MQKTLTYINCKCQNLQVFYAVLAFIEVNSKSRIFLVDENNFQIIKECKKWLKFRVIKKENADNFEVINISIIHSQPYTKIGNYHEAPLIFPKIIMSIFNKPFHEKIDKIYFRGLLTKKRFIEIIFFLFSYMEIKNIIFILKKILNREKEFIIESPLIYFNFTRRGRQTEHKYLDFDYYSEMSAYKYIFCPKGDFVWTYRFFEAIQVGSIPLLKHAIPAYSRFNYLRKINKDIQKKHIDENFVVFRQAFMI